MQNIPSVPHRRSHRGARATAIGVVTALLLGLAAIAGAPAEANLPPISVNVTASSNPVPSGDELTYTIDVVNTGGARVDEVRLSDQINGLTRLILTSTVGSCSQTHNLVTCDAGTLEGGQAWQVTIRGVVTSAEGETLHNTATVTGTKSSTTFTVSSTVNTLVSSVNTGPAPDLTLSIAAPTQVTPGGAITYTLTVNNIGTANATDITVVNTLPAGFSVSGEPPWGTSLFACTHDSSTVTCTGGAVNAGANATITVNAVADPSTTPQTYVDTAVVDPYNAIDESGELNNTASHSTANTPPPPQTGLTIVKQDLKDPIVPGDVQTYKIRVQNVSDYRADSISVVDGTQGLDAASITATTTKGVCTVEAPKVTCTQKSPSLRLNSGESLEITITGTVVATAGTLIRNTATVTGNIRNKGVANTATATTSVRPRVDLTVTQRAVPTHVHASHEPTGFRARDNFDYVITVGNSGLQDATNVVVREPLPTGMRFNSSNPPICSESGGVVTCGGLTVPGATPAAPGGQTRSITLNVVAPPQAGPITSTATVDPTNAIHESDETNNTVSTTTPISTGVDLTVMKNHNAPVVAPSGTLIYTITVSNVGTQDATGVVVRDALPTGTRFREVVGDHNFTCSQDGSDFAGIVECVGGIIAGTDDHTKPVDTATITLTVFAPAPPGLVKNQVRVDPDGAIAEIREDNNINTRLTDIQIGGCCAFNELTIDKQQVAPAGPVAPSGILEWDLVVSNTGSDVAFGIDVRDFLPEGAVFRSAQDMGPPSGAFRCSEDGGVVDCVDGTLDGTSDQSPGPQTRIIRVSVLAPEQPGTYGNQAIIDPGNAIPEADETNNSDAVSTVVQLGGGGSYIDLVVGSTDSPDPVVPSGMLQYQLKPENRGTAVAFDVAVRNVLPAGTVFRSAADTNPGAGAFTCSESGGVVECIGGTLDGSNGDTPAAGDNVRTIHVNVFAPEQPGGYTNQAVIDPAELIAENDETNNTSQVTTVVSVAGGGKYRDLVVKSIDDSVAEPSPGQTYDYTVVVENTGTDAAFNVPVRAVLPPGVGFVQARGSDAGDFNCVESGGVVECIGTLDGSLDQMPVGTTDTITITVKAPMLADSTYRLQARIDPNDVVAESNEANNAAFEETRVLSKVDLSVDNQPGSQSSGSENTWSFSVTATGADGADDVVVVTNLPVGVVPEDVEAAQDGWSCSITQNPVNQVTCVGDLAAGDTASFNVRVYVSANSGEAINSTTIADPDNTVVETDEANNAITKGTTA